MKMAMNMLTYLADVFNGANWLNCPYLRSFLAFLTALILSLAFGRRLIKFLRAHQKFQFPFRKVPPEN